MLISPQLHFRTDYLSLSNDEDFNNKVTCLALSQSLDILCIATRNGKVSFFDPHGKKHPAINDIICKESYYTMMLWDPSNNAHLIGGMDNGQVNSGKVCSSNLQTAKSATSNFAMQKNRDVHNCAVTYLKWKGSNLLSIDRGGYCCFWRVGQDNLTPIQHIHIGNSFSSVDIFHSRNSFAFSFSDGSIQVAGEYDKVATQIISSSNNNRIGFSIINFIVCHRKQDALFVISSSNEIYPCHFNSTGSIVVEKALKFRFDGDLKLVILSDLGQLVGLSQEGNLQSILIEDNKNENLAIVSSPAADIEEQTTFIEYSSGILATVTLGNRVMLYQEVKLEKCIPKWIPIYSSQIDSFKTSVGSIMISKRYILISSGADIVSLMQTYLLSTYTKEKYVIQVNDGTFMVFESSQKGASAIVETFQVIQGISMDSEYICIWSRDNIQVYSHYNICEIFDEISMPVQTLAILNRSLYIAQGQSLLVTDLHGVIRLTIRIPFEDGVPLHILIASDNLIMITDNGTIKVMSVCKKSIPEEIFCHRHCLVNYGISANSITSIKANTFGSLISILHSDKRNSEKTSLCLIDIKSGNIQKLQRIVRDDESIMAHHWDANDTRVLVCEVCNIYSSKSKACILFIEKNQNVYIHDNFKLEATSSKILGVSLPFVLQLDDTLSTHSFEKITHLKQGYELNKIQITGYENCEEANPTMIATRTDFLLFLASGDLERALICAIHIQDIYVWKRLGLVCIKEENLKIAKNCLHHLDETNSKNWLFFTDPIMTSEDKDIQASVLAELAIKLGMIGEASAICKKYDRIEMLCSMLRHHGLWNEAFDVAKNVTVLEKSLFFHYGKLMEELGDINKAVSCYIQSSLSRRSLIQKMLHMSCDIETCLIEANDKELNTLYALHMEHLGNHQQAKTFYSIANDTTSLIRVEYDTGSEIPSISMLEQGGHRDTAHYIAKSLELKGDIAGAIEYYGASGMLNHAIRLCHQYNNDDEILMKLALESAIPQRLSSAMHFFHKKGCMEKAVILFMKAGDRENARKALLDIQLDQTNCQTTFDFIYALRDELPKEKVLECAVLLMKTEECLDKSSKLIESLECSVSEILEYCSLSGVIFTEAIVDCIFENRISTKEEVGSVAHMCNIQGNFLLASVLFNKVAETVQAITSLLKLGDIQKIIDFASKTNSAEVYTLAANYLQTLNYEDDPLIQKTLLSFYMKAGKYSVIVSLLTTWSEKEVFDGCYNMAYKWLEEAKNYGLKVENWSNTKENAEIERKLKDIKDFMYGRDLFQQGHVNQAKEMCLNLLRRCDTIMKGDCYGLIIEMETNCKLSYDLIEEMIQKSINPCDYIDISAIKYIYESVGKRWIGDDNVIKPITDEDAPEEEDLADDNPGLNEEEQNIIEYASARDWDKVRELMSSSENFSLAFICCMFSKGPPQSVAVIIKRTNHNSFREKDKKSRYPLHYLCYHGAPIYTILFVFHQCPDALGHRDTDGKTPLEYALISPWQHGEKDEKSDLIKELQKAWHQETHKQN